MDSPIGITVIGLFTVWIAKNLAQYLTREKYEVSANVSLQTKFGNFMLWPYYWFTLRKEFKPLDLDSIRRVAVKKEKVGSDFGDTWYEEPYKILINIVNTGRSQWTPIGYVAYGEMFLRLLRKRLRFFNYIKDDKVKEYMKNNPVREPIFVFGMPRTGTTFLHRLLSLDPNARAPLTYELMDPIERVPDDVKKDAAKRIKFCKAQIDTILTLIPHVNTIHEIGAELPEECLVAIGMDMPLLFETFHFMAEHSKELAHLDGTQFYKNYESQLQVLAHNAHKSGNVELAKKRWVLKCPVHMATLDYLVKVFPDARLIWTHRDLNNALPSLASLFRLGPDLTQSTVKLDRLGRGVITYANLAMERAEKFFSSNPTNPCSNVKYEELIKNPIAVVKSVYKELGYDFTPEYEKILEEYLTKNKAERAAIKKKQGGKVMHNYSLEEYGMSKDDVENLSWYTEKYL